MSEKSKVVGPSVPAAIFKSLLEHKTHASPKPARSKLSQPQVLLDPKNPQGRPSVDNNEIYLDFLRESEKKEKTNTQSPSGSSARSSSGKRRTSSTTSPRAAKVRAIDGDRPQMCICGRPWPSNKSPPSQVTSEI